MKTVLFWIHIQLKFVPVCVDYNNLMLNLKMYCTSELVGHANNTSNMNVSAGRNKNGIFHGIIGFQWRDSGQKFLHIIYPLRML